MIRIHRYAEAAATVWNQTAACPESTAMEVSMASIAKMIEISADSEKSFEDALHVGIQEANESLRNVQSVWIKDQEVLISSGAIKTYRLHLKVSFVLER